MMVVDLTFGFVVVIVGAIREELVAMPSGQSREHRKTH